MSIQSPVGTLDIKNATLRVGKLEVSNIQGVDTALNVTRANSVLIYDDQASTTTFTGFTSSVDVRDTGNGYIDLAQGYVYWGQKLPNAWVMDFEMDIRSGTNAGPLYANVFSTTNTGGDGYSFTFNDSNDKISLYYDSTLLTETTVSGLFTASEDSQKVVINFERGLIGISLAGSRKFYYKDIERETHYVNGEYVSFSSASTDGRKIRDLRIVNGEKWVYSGESNVVYTQGSVGIGVTDPTVALDVSGTVKATAFDGDGSAITNISSANVGDFASNVVRIENLETSNGHIWSNLASNVTTLRGEIDSNLATARTDLQSNVTILRDEIDSNLATARTDLQSNVTILRDEIDSNLATARTDLQSNVTILRDEIDSNLATARTDLQSNVTILRGEIDSNLATARTDLQSNVTILRGEIDSNLATATTDLQSNVTILRGEIDSNLATARTDLQSNVTILRDTAITFTGTKTFEDDVVLESNLRVQGDLLVANTVNMTVSDPILELGSNNLNTGDVGIVMTRHGASNSNVAVFFDETADTLKLGYTLNGAEDSTLEFDSNALAVSVQGALTASTVSGNGSGLTSLNASNLASGTVGRPISTTTGTFSGDVEVTGELTTKSNVFLGVMSAHEKEGTLEFGRADGADRVHNIKVYNSSTQANNYMKFQIHAGGASAGTVTDNVLYLRGDGNVGIGTNSPGQKLEVGHYGGALSSDFGAIRITNHATNLHATSLARFDISLGDINSGTGSGNRKLIFNSKTTTTDSGTDILCLDGLNNNVGIGTTSPGNSRVAIYNNETDANSTSSLGLELAAPWIRIGDGIGGRTMTNGSGIKFHDSGVAHYSVGQKDGKFRIASTGIQGNELFPSGYTEGVVITTTGNVGIATDSPAYTLDVSGTLHAGNSYFDTVYIGGSTSRGLRSVSGQFGTVQTTGEGAGNWEGYSIDGRYVFMSADNNSCGIYNDLDNKWILYAYRNSYVRLYYAGAEKLATNSGGITVTGSITGSMSTSLSPGSYLTGTAYNGSTARTFDVDATEAATARKVVARDANGSFSANVVTATSVSGNGSGLTSLNASNISSGTLGTAHIPNLDAGKITSGTLTRPINASTGVFTHVSLGTNKYPTLGGNW